MALCCQILSRESFLPSLNRGLWRADRSASTNTWPKAGSYLQELAHWTFSRSWHVSYYSSILSCLLTGILSDALEAWGHLPVILQSTRLSVHCEGLRIRCFLGLAVLGITWTSLSVLKDLQGCTQKSLRKYILLGINPGLTKCKKSYLIPIISLCPPLPSRLDFLSSLRGSFVTQNSGSAQLVSQFSLLP